MSEEEFRAERQRLDRAGALWEPVRSNDEKVQLFESIAKVEQAKARQEELKTEREKLKQGVPIPQPTDPSNIVLEWALPKDMAAMKLEFLIDPFLPAKCVVGFFGRGSTAKSSFLATLAAEISEDWSTLWISVEELNHWITQRHINAGGADGTLAVFAFKAVKRDASGRAIGSAFDVYRDLQSAIVKAQEGAAQLHHPPRPLRLVVLDTAVGLTGWAKGENPNDDAAVKKLLGYLQMLADDHNLCIAIVGHANKAKHDYFADSVAGSSAWTNSPRLSFVHARDRREEHSYVMRVAKTNLSSAFGVAYSTEPVLTLHQHEDGHASVMCKVKRERIVWGDEESLEMFEAATRKPDEESDGGGHNHRATLVENVLMEVVQQAHLRGEVTRDEVQSRLGREVSRREWLKVDERLRLAPFQYQVEVAKGPQNKLIYRTATEPAVTSRPL
jgi:hypothetical protein